MVDVDLGFVDAEAPDEGLALGRQILLVRGAASVADQDTWHDGNVTIRPPSSRKLTVRVI